MKNWVVGFLILIVSVLLVLVITDQQTQDQQTQPEPIVFNLKYVGLDGGKDELRYNSYWGFGGSETDTPFITEVKKNVEEPFLVYNPNFENAQWSAIELSDKKAVAFYFDLDADGKLSDNEKILPVNSEESSGTTTTDFVTPDFTLKANDKEIPFRAALRVNFYQGSSRPSCMWSPSCVLEGTSKINGKKTKMILFAYNFKGKFDEFGNCSYYLDNDEKEIEQNIARQRLSSIINYEDKFYNMMFDGAHEKDKTIQVTLEKYTGTTGELAVKLNADTDIPATLSSASISSTSNKDKPIYFNISSEQTNLPTASYRLDRGYIDYGPDDNKWRLNFTDGPEFIIDSDKTSTVELGKPTLSISAVDESKRYQSDVKEQTTYSKGTTVLLSRKVTGVAGESYGYFWKKNLNNSINVKPDIKIVGPDGAEIASAEMEYG